MGKKIAGTKALGWMIGSRMIEKGMNQSSLAKAVKTDQPRINKFIHGNFRRESRILGKVCKFLSIDQTAFVSDPLASDAKRIKTLTKRLIQNSPDRKAKTIIRLLEEISEL